MSTSPDPLTSTVRLPQSERAPFASLRADTRGALLVIGIVLGTLLVGALYWLVGIGDAIIWRESAQSAADAAAFDNAIWHARGMNMIVALNIVMSLVLSVLVLWRLAFMVLVIVMLVTLVVTLLTEGATIEVLGAEAEVLTDMMEFDPELSETILLILSGMSAAEVVVASFTPVLAAPSAVSDTDAAYHVSSDTFSASLLPTLNPALVANLAPCFFGGEGKGKEKDGAAGGDGSNAGGSHGGGATQSGGSGGSSGTSAPTQTGGASGRGGGTEHGAGDGSDFRRQTTIEVLKELLNLAQKSGNLPGVTDKLGMPFSLPVQTDNYSLLCRKAGEFWPRQIAGVVSRVAGLGDGDPFAELGPLASTVEAALGVDGQNAALAGLLADVSGLANGLAPAVFCLPVSDAFQTLGQKVIDQIVDRAVALIGAGATKGAGGVVKQLKEQAAALADAKRVYDGIIGLLQSVSGDDHCGSPAKVWNPAQNGNVYLRSTAVVVKPARTATSDAGIELADGKRTGSLVAAEPRPIWAHAEMFFDCAGTWTDCGPDAMWQLRWRARLRRVQPFGALLEEAEKGNPVNGDEALILRLFSDVVQLLGDITGVKTDALAFVPATRARPVSETVTFSYASAFAASELVGGANESLATFVASRAGASSDLH